LLGASTPSLPAPHPCLAAERNNNSTHQLQAHTQFAEALSAARYEEAVSHTLPCSPYRKLLILNLLPQDSPSAQGPLTPPSFRGPVSITNGGVPSHFPLPLAAPAWRLSHTWVPLLEKRTSSGFGGAWGRRLKTLGLHNKCKQNTQNLLSNKETTKSNNFTLRHFKGTERMTLTEKCIIAISKLIT